MQESSTVFAGKWITTAEFSQLQPQLMYHRQLDKSFIPKEEPDLQNRHVLFRRRFHLPENFRQVVIRISADDYYKLYLNGEFVGQGPTPGYPCHYFYNEMDITGMVHPGENLLAVHTYYQGLINRVWVSGDRQHGLIYDLLVDGELCCASDEATCCREHSGFTSAGKTGYSTQYLERYDAGAAEVDFQKPAFDDSNWQPAAIRRYCDYQLYPQPSRQLVFEKIRPATIQAIPGGYRVDFGGIFVGDVEFVATGPKGAEITMRFAQELWDDGQIRYELRANCRYEEFMLLSGKKEGDKLVQFDYKSFRYMEVTFPEGVAVAPESILFNCRHYPFELQAQCNSDNPDAQAVWRLCVDSLHYGVQEVIQDCMEREKGYYLGDGCYSLLAHCLLTRRYELMEKLFDDFLRTAFIDRGLMTCSSCSFMQEIAEYPLMMFTLAMEYLTLTGNKEFLDQRYDALADVLDYYREKYAEADGLLNNLDKWCVVEWPWQMRDGYDVDLTEGQVCTTKHVALNAYYLGAIKALNRIARELGRKPYCDVKPLEEAFVTAFYDPEKHLFRDSVESTHISVPGNVYAAFHELFPDKQGEAQVVALIREKRLTRGMLFVTFPLLAFLKKQGEDELMAQLLVDPEAWMNIIAEGGTRTFEGWGKDFKWNTSLFHLTLTCAAVFLTDWPLKEALSFK